MALEALVAAGEAARSTGSSSVARRIYGSCWRRTTAAGGFDTVAV